MSVRANGVWPESLYHAGFGHMEREVLKKFDFELNAKKTASVFGVNKVFVAPIDWLYNE